MPYTSSLLFSFPKIDLHRHLEGSLRLETLLDISSQHNLGYRSSAELRPLVQVVPGNSNTAQNFLSKFTVLRQFYRSPEIIRRMVIEAIEDAVQDNIRYLELRFTPVALSRVRGFSIADVTRWVVSAAEEAEKILPIKVRLIVSINRHESLSLAEEVITTALSFKDNGIVGLDLAGNEGEFPAAPFLSLFSHAQSSGLHLSIHAGEWSGADNIRQAIEEMGAERIGHGVRVMEDQSVVALACERGIPFEVCLTSNVQSGVFPSLEAHPIKDMLRAGLRVTINTDDPGISNIKLVDELVYLHNQAGLSSADLADCTITAACVAFIPEKERLQLVEALKKEFAVLPLI